MDCAFGVAEISRLRIFRSATGLQIGQVMRRRGVGMKLRDCPRRRGEHLGGSLLVSPAIPESTKDDRRQPRNDQHDQADAPRIHLFSVPHGRVVSCERRKSRAGARRRSERRRLSSASDDDGGEPSRDARAAAENMSMPYESWVDRQIREAIERGEFDNLPGQGRPIKGLNGRDDENWWVKAYLEREQLPLPLPTSLALRREVRALPETLADVTDEESVREIVSGSEPPDRRVASDPRRRPTHRHRPRQRGAGSGRVAPPPKVIVTKRALRQAQGA